MPPRKNRERPSEFFGRSVDAVNQVLRPRSPMRIASGAQGSEVHTPTLVLADSGSVELSNTPGDELSFQERELPFSAPGFRQRHGNSRDLPVTGGQPDASQTQLQSNPASDRELPSWSSDNALENIPAPIMFQGATADDQIAIASRLSADNLEYDIQRPLGLDLHASPAVSQPEPRPNNPSDRADHIDTASSVFKTALIACRSSLKVVPVFKGIMDVLCDCVDNIPVAVKNHQDYDELASELTAALHGLETHLSQVSPDQMTKGVVKIIEELKEQAEHIKQRQDRTVAKKYIYAEGDIDDLVRRYRRVEALFRQLQSDAILSVWRVSNQSLRVLNENLDVAKKTLLETRLAKLNPAYNARYDSDAASQIQRRECAPNTRRLVLHSLQKWASGPRDAKIYWMNGMAGTGKTTIAYSLCSGLEDSHQLAASFFCSRSLPDCCDMKRIIPTIAYQLARFCQPFQDALCEVLADDPDVGSRGVMRQFEKLLSEPMQRAKNQVPSGLLVVVIDALDECSSRTDASSILEALLRFTDDLPLKFFVTCRPDRSLLDLIADHQSFDRSVYHLHDIEESIVHEDIKTYLRVELRNAHASAEEIELLSNHSGRLFIHAATTVRYVMSKTGSVNHRERLDAVLGTGRHSSDKVNQPLDILYTTILAAALESSDMEPWETERVKTLLHTIVCAREILTVKAIADLLQMGGVEQVRYGIEPLLSVLHLNEQSEAISTLHASFPDYMNDASRSGRFYCDERQQNEQFAIRCFDTMTEMLRFNICGFESSFVMNKDVIDLTSRVDEAIPPHLFYACRYWIDHIRRASHADGLLPLLHDFLRHRILFWAEVMSLKHATRDGVQALLSCYQWMKNNSVSDEVRGLCSDAQRFIEVVGASPVCNSTPHIYVSTLGLWDKRAPMWKHYGARTRGMTTAVGPAIDNRQSAAVAVWRYTKQIYAMSVSPDGKLVASGSHGGSICIWDAHSGGLLMGPLLGHEEDVCSIAFSHDGSHFASGSRDKTVRIWSTKTGREVLEPLRGHTDMVWSVAYSPDGKYLASGSKDCTVRTWSALTGTPAGDSLTGHTDKVVSIAYSPDGKHIVSGSPDKTIRIWDFHSRRLLIEPLTGHTDRVNSVTYSPDGSHIASGSADHTIRIWDAHTGQLLTTLSNGHTKPVQCVSYSPDGGRIVSSSHDGTVRVWDALNGGEIAGPFTGHTHWVYSVAFMPDSDRIVSCSSDHTIRIWDPRASGVINSKAGGHTEEVYAVAFSPNGQYLVSGSDDNTICIWETETGRMTAGPFTGHTAAVHSVAFSPLGDCVASGSKDCTARIWDAQTGRSLVAPLEGHSDMVSSVVFSPDGSRLVSGSHDYTLRVWDIESGHAIGIPFTGHTAWVRAIVYSPDGQCIASSSDDYTIRVWDAHTGATVTGPFEHYTTSLAYSSNSAKILFCSDSHDIFVCDAQTGVITTGPYTGHTDWIGSVAFSADNNHIISGSNDNTIRVWDVNTGQPAAGPYNAHIDWVYSIACSPDGHLIASGSSDHAIRIWDSRLLTSTPQKDFGCWTMNEDGWVVGHDLSLLLWIPLDLRKGLKWPQNVAVIHQQGTFSLDYSGAYIGTEWTKCYQSE